MAARFHGKIDHTEETITLLYKTQYRTFETLRMLTRMAIGVIMAVLGLTVEMPMWGRAILMLIGCWLLVSGDFPGVARADRALEARKGALPKMSYDFYANHVHLSGEGSMNIAYGKFRRLVEDDAYLYLFVSKDSVCMVERATLTPTPEENFMKFIEEKTGLRWRRMKSLLLMNAQDLLQAIQDRRNRKP